MNPEENITTRYQVPETDPVYQEEKERRQGARNSGSSLAGAVTSYEVNLRAAAIHRRTESKLSERLASLDDSADSQDVQSLKQSIEDSRQTAIGIEALAHESLQREFVDLTMRTSLLFNSPGQEDRKEYVTQEMFEMLGAPEIREEMEQHFGTDLRGLNHNSLYMKAAEGAFSDDLMLAIAKMRREKFEAQEAQLAELVTRTKEEFKSAVNDAVEAGRIPEEAGESLHRIDTVPVHLSDRLNDVMSYTYGHREGLGRIGVVNEQLNPEGMARLRKTLFHELLHEVSGLSTNIESKQIDDSFAMHTVRERKIGIALRSKNSNYTRNEWLNEAVTEWLALQLSGYDGDTQEYAYGGSYSYTAERKELDRLFSSGLDEGVVLAAYFENITSEQENSDKGRHFAKLIKEVNALEGEHGFNMLENVHILNGIKIDLYDNQAYETSRCKFDKDRLKKGSKIILVSVNVGVHENTAVAEQFTAFLQPFGLGTDEEDIRLQEARLRKTLTYLKAKYGSKFQYSLEEEST